MILMQLSILQPYKAVGESVRKPLEYYRNNLLSLINLLEAMKGTAYRQHGIFIIMHCLRPA